MSQLKNLNLAGNWFFYFPNFCDKNNKSTIPNLVELNLENSKILSLYKPITCLDNLENLNLAGLSLRLLYANTFDWKTVIYIYVCGKCRTQFMLPMEKSVTFTGACANEIIPSIILSERRSC